MPKSLFYGVKLYSQTLTIQARTVYSILYTLYYCVVEHHEMNFLALFGFLHSVFQDSDGQDPEQLTQKLYIN